MCLKTEDKRVRIICGHYGSGKTEFAVNYAVKLAGKGGNPVLADIDTINPYFRSRETSALLEKRGVRVVGSSIQAASIDVPAVSAGVYTVFDDRTKDAVVDVGGDQGGVKVLKRFSDHFNNPEDYDLFFVINANRPETKTLLQIRDFIVSFEMICGLKISGLINNTHMLKLTTVDDISAGYKLACEVSQSMEIPLRYNAGLRDLAEDLPEEIKADFFPIDLFMRDEWMS